MDKVPEIITASDARESLYRLIDRAAEEHCPIVITGKRNKAVLVSEEDWNGMQETIYLHSIPGMVASIKKARKEPLSKAVKAKDIDW